MFWEVANFFSVLLHLCGGNGSVARAGDVKGCVVCVKDAAIFLAAPVAVTAGRSVGHPKAVCIWPTPSLAVYALIGCRKSQILDHDRFDVGNRMIELPVC